jgi:hypothetical protein
MVPYAVTGGEIFVADRKATCAPMPIFGGKLSAKPAVLATDGLLSYPIGPQIIPFSITDQGTVPNFWELVSSIFTGDTEL